MASERKFVAENIRRVLLKEYLMKPRGPGSSSEGADRPSRT